MGLQDSVSWYQKKIGTYDKQQWEKTVEQRILHGFTHVLKKTAKLKTDLIDVDLVRGSSFPKAKPKHGLITVTRLAFIRWLLLPFYSTWWVQQTCFSIYAVLLILYILEFANLVIYFTCQDDQILEHVSAYEVVIPAAMMLILSIIHSQIVSTNNSSSQTLAKTKSKRRRVKRRGTNLERNKSFNVESKNESFPNKTPLQTNFCYGNRKDVKNKSPNEQQCSRQSHIVWRTPSQEEEGSALEPPKGNESVRTDMGGGGNQNLKPPTVEDDGFESLNGNGSSENGDENQENVNCEEVLGEGERSQVARSHFKRINFVINDNKKNFKGNDTQEENTDESEGAVKTCNDKAVTELFKMDKCYKDDCGMLDDCEEVDHISCKGMWMQNLGRKKSTCPTVCRRQSALGLCSTCETCERETDHKDTDSDRSSGKLRVKKSTSPQRLLQRRRGSLTLQAHTARMYYNSSCESDDGDRFDGPHLTEGTTSAAEWIGITTNSEECSVTSEIDESEGPNESKVLDDHPFAWEFQLSPSSIVSPSCAASDKVSCTIWENKDVKRADLSVLDISSAIIARVETMQESMDYLYAVNMEDVPFSGKYVIELRYIFSILVRCLDNFSHVPGVTLPIMADENLIKLIDALAQSQGLSDKFFDDTRTGSFPCVEEYGGWGNSSHLSCKRFWEVTELARDPAQNFVDFPLLISFVLWLTVSVVIALLPSFCRVIETTHDSSGMSGEALSHQLLVEPVLSLSGVDLSEGAVAKLCQCFYLFLDVAFGSTILERFVIITAMFERFMLSALFFFLVAVAERTFKQRFLYAKFFSRLTSFRRARKSELPHFRLNKVRNIKTWLSVRSYLKKRGPQRSVDVIVSAAFIITLLLLSFLSVELLKDNMDDEYFDNQPKMISFEKRRFDSVRLHSEYNLEALVWCLVLGVYILRFMTLGNKTNRKYRNLSVLLTEQINLYLQIEQKPNKKEELMVANSVLKLAADLLKELECPFKISGLSANPYVYTITKVVILSALSGVLSEMLGFKLKLHKIKIK